MKNFIQELELSHFFTMYEKQLGHKTIFPWDSSMIWNTEEGWVGP